MSDKAPERIWVWPSIRGHGVWNIKRVDDVHVEYRLVHKPDPGQTHWIGCYTEPGHHECAVAEVERLSMAIHVQQLNDKLAMNDANERYALKAEVERLRERAETAEEDRDARRQSLANEIDGVLRARNLWSPPNPADLITAVAQAIDDLRARAETAERALEFSRELSGGRKRYAHELRTERDALRAKVAELMQALGLLSTLAPSMVIDSENPVGMAQQIVAALAEATPKAVARDGEVE